MFKKLSVDAMEWLTLSLMLALFCLGVANDVIPFPTIQDSVHGVLHMLGYGEHHIRWVMQIVSA